jgi:alanine racemase
MKGLSETTQFRPTQALIDLEALRHNFSLARELAGAHRPQLAIIKANAYGHGALQAGRVLARAGAEGFGVATPNEAMELRDGGIDLPIYLLAGPMGAPGDLLKKHRLTPVIFNQEQLQHLQNSTKDTLEFHLKVDTGMTRLGVLPAELESFLGDFKKYPRLKLTGVMTHLAQADETFEGPTAEQFKLFAWVKNLVAEKFPDAVVFHIANSAAILGGKVGAEDWARPGIMLYGANPHPRFEAGRQLRPVMTLQTQILSLKEIPKGTAVSYGGEWVAPRPSRIAVLPIGYADGYLRSLSNRGKVLIEGRPYPVVGRVCMDLTMVDVTEAPAVRLGSEVLLWGPGLPVEEIAQLAGTISYELLCSISPRVSRVYWGED